MLEFVSGNMFDEHADIMINTVNCVGVMGKGVALEFKNRYPKMFTAYRQRCRNHMIFPGSVFVWPADDGSVIFNAATKDHWKKPSEYQYVSSCLQAICANLCIRPFNLARLIVMPALGCGHGGLDWEVVKPMIEEELGDIRIDGTIKVFTPQDSRQFV